MNSDLFISVSDIFVCYVIKRLLDLSQKFYSAFLCVYLVDFYVLIFLLFVAVIISVFARICRSMLYFLFRN